MKTSILTLLGCLWLASSAVGQTITDYRYWWNDDIANLTTESLAPASSIELDAILPSAALGNGLHTLSIQFRDDAGNWSAPYTQKFNLTGNLAQYEYWFDDDIASRVTVSTDDSDTQDLQLSLDASALSPGVHRITVRSVDSTGESSAPVTQHFKVTGGDLVSWQYWFNDEIANRVSVDTAPPTSSIDLVEELNAEALGPGNHTVTWRAIGANGNWSVPITHEFSIPMGIDEVPGLNTLVLFPSPATDVLNVKFDSSSPATRSMEVLNEQGQLVLTTENFNGPLGTLDIGALAPGVYLIRFGHNGAFVTHRFIKQ